MVKARNAYADALKLRPKNDELKAKIRSIDDLKYVQEYFQNQEKRNPTITEIKVLDTYWSDHCRHTTFMTQIEGVDIEDGKYNEIIKETYSKYVEARNTIYIDRQKDMCLMDMATIAVKELKKAGKLQDLDEESIIKLQKNESIVMIIDDKKMEITSNMVDIRISSKEGFNVGMENNNFIILDTTLTEELILEGIAREFISKIQNLRKSNDFDIVDRIIVRFHRRIPVN